MKKQSKKLMSVAYHEAGHAVAAFFLKIPLASVTIVPKEGVLGLAQFKMPGWVKTKLDEGVANDAKLDAWIKNHIVATLAGMNAEKLFTGRANHGGAMHDNETVADLAMVVCSSSAEIDAYLKWLGIKTQQFTKTPFFRAGVEAVAQELMQCNTLTSREVADTVRQSIQEAVLLNIQKVTATEELPQ